MLALLPVADRGRLLDRAQLVELKPQHILGTAGKPLALASFPTDCLISLVTTLPDGRAMEVAMVGYEGLVGVGCTLPAPVSEFDAVVQSGGYAWQIDTSALAALARQCEALNCLLNSYLHVQISQYGRQAACCWFHSLEQRLCRWLLMTQDRLRSSNFMITHEYLSHALGTRRAGVTTAAGALQERELIAYSRGHVLILDRAGLLNRVCTCYGLDIAVYRSMMSAVLGKPG